MAVGAIWQNRMKWIGHSRSPVSTSTDMSEMGWLARCRGQAAQAPFILDLAELGYSRADSPVEKRGFGLKHSLAHSNAA